MIDKQSIMIRKILLPLLVIIAAPIYIWDVLLIVKASLPVSTSDQTSLALRKAVDLNDLTGALMQPVTFIEKGKNPFARNKNVPVVKAASSLPPASPQPRQQRPEVVPPAIAITGIMWNANNPLVVLSLPNGSSSVGKPGQVMDGGIIIKKIEKTRIQVTYQGKDFWIEK